MSYLMARRSPPDPPLKEVRMPTWAWVALLVIALAILLVVTGKLTL